MPGRGSAGALRPDRDRQVQQREGDDPGDPQRLAEEQAQHPADLDEPDAYREPQRNRSPSRVLARGAQPVGDERDPHDHVAHDHDPEVEALERAPAHPPSRRARRRSGRT